MKLRDTAAIVTGAASGLGAATAFALAAQGVTVYGLDLERSIEAADRSRHAADRARDLGRTRERRTPDHVELPADDRGQAAEQRPAVGPASAGRDHVDRPDAGRQRQVADPVA